MKSESEAELPLEELFRRRRCRVGEPESVAKDLGRSDRALESEEGLMDEGSVPV